MSRGVGDETSRAEFAIFLVVRELPDTVKSEIPL
jgi:hypothetical protein